MNATTATTATVPPNSVNLENVKNDNEMTKSQLEFLILELEIISREIYNVFPQPSLLQILSNSKRFPGY